MLPVLQAHYGEHGKSFQMGNLLWHHPAPMGMLAEDPLCKVYLDEVQVRLCASQCSSSQ